MTKLKNTKKGMAKKALSISLVAAMLATSNVPVWAAEDLFSDGSAAVEAPSAEVDTFSAAPVEEASTDAPALAAHTDPTANLNAETIQVSGDVEADFQNVLVTDGDTYKYSVNWYVVDADYPITKGMSNTTVDAAAKLVGYTNSFTNGAIKVNFSDRGGTPTALTIADVGKKLAVVLYASDNDGATWTTITDADYAEITYDAASNYVKLYSNNVPYDTVLDAETYKGKATIQPGFSVESSSYKWVDGNGVVVADKYKTTSDDINKTYYLSATIVDGNNKTVGTATLAVLTINSKTVGEGEDVSIVSTTWQDGVKTDNAGNPVYTYDGTAHYPKLKSVTLSDGTVVDASNATYTQLDVADATNANTNKDTKGVSYVAEITTEKYGTITVSKTLYIEPVNLTTEGSLTVSKGFEYNKNATYTVDSDEALSKAGMSVTVGGKSLTRGTDYTVKVTASPTNAVGANAFVQVTGNGNYEGTLTVQAPITAKELKEDYVALYDKYGNPLTSTTYDGNEVEPIVKVTIDGATLEKDKDYTVSYSNNKEVGTATVTVIGKGNYTGTVNKTFKIESASLDGLVNAIVADLKISSAAEKYQETYTGKAIDIIKDAYDGMKFVKNRDFTVEYVPQNINAGDVVVKLHGINNYKDAETKEIKLKINPRSLNDKDVKVAIEDLTYDTDLTKEQIKKAVTVTYNGMTLVENTDYTLDNNDITQKGNKVTLKLKGIGNYKDERSVTVSMTEKDINTVTLPKIDAQKYTGIEYKLTGNGTNVKLESSGESVKFEIKDGDKVLSLGTDYKVANYENNKNVGTATINIVGMGAYKGTASISFPIVDQKLTGSIVKNGSPIIPDVAYNYDEVSKYGGYTFEFTETVGSGLNVVDQNGDIITKDKYTVTYKDNTAAGTATITVEGKDGYDLYAVNTFKIVPAKITGLTIKTISLDKTTFNYTGEEIKPSATVTLKDGTYKLVEGTDYELVYSDNVNVTNSATVKVVGLGNYAGSVKDGDLGKGQLKETFTIEKADIRPTEVVAADVAYAGGLPVEPKITITNRYSGKALVEDTDYTVEITKGGIDIGQVTAEITLTTSGKKNYGFTGNSVGNLEEKCTVNFNVKAQDLANVEISEIADQVATGEQIKPAIVVMNGKARMVEGYDYEVTYGENKEVGTGTVKITPVEGNKNYVGSKEVTFNIVEEAPEVGKAVISEVKVSGNTVTPVLSEEVAGAVGYDYVLATEEDYTNGRVQISKNILTTNTNFYYVEEGTYYVYCHAWKRDENGVKVFGEWSNLAEVTVTATTPETPSITKVEKSSNGKHLRITWTKSDNATGYDVVMGQALRKVNGEYRPVDYGTAVKKVTNGNTVSVIFYNIPKGTYYVGLHAYNRTSETGTKVFSKWSNSKKVTF